MRRERGREMGRGLRLHKALQALWATPPGWGRLAAVNHTTMGLRFIAAAAVFFAIGGLLAMLIRIQLATPDSAFLGAEVYNQVFTMHGTAMMFLFAIPMFEGFAIYLLPKLLGARDMAFPRMTAYGFWCYVFGGAIATPGLDYVDFLIPGIIIQSMVFGGFVTALGLSEDLKKGRSSNQSFWLMGQPDVDLRKRKDGLWEVQVNGFDYFDPRKGDLVSGGTKQIAMWSLDVDYDNRSLMPHQVFFPMAGAKDGWNRLKKTIRAELDEDLLEQFHGTVSLPFEAGDQRRVAVKIVDDRGIESLKIIALGA